MKKSAIVLLSLLGLVSLGLLYIATANEPYRPPHTVLFFPLVVNEAGTEPKIILTNPSDQRAHLTLAGFYDDGQLASVFETDIEAQSTRTATASELLPLAKETLISGWVRVETAAEALQGFFSFDDEQLFQAITHTEKAFTLSPGLPTTSPLSRIVLINPNLDPAAMVVRCLDVRQRLLSETHLSLPPYGRLQKPTEDFLSGTNPDDLSDGRIEIESDVELVVFPSSYSSANSTKAAGAGISSAPPVLLSTIRVGNKPQGVAINPRTNRAVVANTNSNDVSVVDLSTQRVIATVPVGHHPSGAAINPNTNTAVITNRGHNNISLINLADNRVIATIAVGRQPVAVAVHPERNLAVVANQGSAEKDDEESPNTVSVVDLARRSVTATILVGRKPQSVAVNPATSQAVVANRDSHNVSIIDLNTNRVIATVSVGQGPEGVAINPVTNQAVVANRRSGTLSVIDLAMGRVVSTISVGGHPVGLDVSGVTNVALVANNTEKEKDDDEDESRSAVSLVDLNTNTVLAVLPVGRKPQGVAINANSNVALVSNTGRNTVSVIQLPFPVPEMSNLSPASTTAGGNSFTLTITGRKFFTSSLVKFNGTPLATTFVTAQQLTAMVPASLIAQAGTAPITVVNPAPGGGTSNALPFTINNPIPTITTISPTATTAGGAAFTLTVNGTNFVSGTGGNSVVRWGGTSLTTTFVNSTQLTAAVPANLMAQAGTVPVTVFNPAPGGGASNAVNFTINNPVPTITSIAPLSTLAGGASFTLTVNGTNFVNGTGGNSVVRFSGTGLVTTWVSSTRLTATVPAGLIAQGGTASVTVFNPAPGGGSSSAVNFTITNPVPTLTTLSRTSVTAGSPSFTLTVNGTNFISGTGGNSVVRFGSTGLATTFVNGTQLTASVPLSLIAQPSTVSVTVFNPAPGGGTSNAVNFTINNPLPAITSLSLLSTVAGGTDFTLTVNGTNFVSGSGGNSVVRFGSTSLATTVVSGTQLTALVPSSLIAQAGVVPVTVFNPAPGGGTSSAVNFTINNPVPTLTTLSRTSVTAGSPAFTLTVNGTNFVSGSGGNSVVRFGSTDLATTFVSGTQLTASVPASLIAQPGAVSITVFNPTPGGGVSNAVNFTIGAAGSTGPTPINRTVPTIFAPATQFLYTGSNPIQVGVAPGTIDPKRAAVLRGKVTTPDGTPLAGVKITVLNHPEYGSTLTNSDGMFDMAVNGGGRLTVSYDKVGYPCVQRQIVPNWMDYAWLPDVVMTPYDSQVTVIDFSAPVQVARSTPITDARGTRQKTLFFMQGTTATMVFPDGSTQVLPRLSVRATEFTVGSTGPAAMPAALPPSSGYTYAVEFSADEAIAAGAKQVRFSQPVISYMENFLNIPVGMGIPVGSYGCDNGCWIPSTDGRVIKILSITGGMADLVIDRSGQLAGAAALATLGITDAERRQLAALYQPGQSLWRTMIDHFTPWDENYPFGLPLDTERPNMPAPSFDYVDNDCKASGSIIGCRNQTLGEAVAITGTPFSLNYRNERVKGRKDFYTLKIPLSKAQVPASLRRIELEILVAGQRFTQTFPGTANQTASFTWDGKDAYGRLLQGVQRITVRIGYVYGLVYMGPGATTGGISFRRFGEQRMDIFTMTEFTARQEWFGAIGGWDAAGQGLGGWSLNVHHVYDPIGRALYYGGSNRRSSQSVKQVIRTIAGMPTAPRSLIIDRDGVPATQVTAIAPNHMTVGPDGSIYFADGYCRIRRVKPDGIITTVAGIGSASSLSCGFSGDGGPATQAALNNPQSVALGPDGSLYITDDGNNRIRRIDPNGIITTVAGTGIRGSSSDNIPATQAMLDLSRTHNSIAIGPDCTLYIAEGFLSNRIRQVGPDGIITTVAGTGAFGPGLGSGGGLATQTPIGGPDPTGFSIAVGPDGSFYFGDWDCVGRVGPDGIIKIAAGTCGRVTPYGDGNPATSVTIIPPIRSIAVSPDGLLYLADGNNRIRRVESDGTIMTVVGVASAALDPVPPPPGIRGQEGITATQAALTPVGIAVGPDGKLYISEGSFWDGQSTFFNPRIAEVVLPLPGFSGTDIAVASEDGSELYVFDASGRHLRTVDALTGTIIYRFTYDTAGRLAAIQDIDNDITRIERDANGNPTAVVAQDGQRTVLSLDSNGYIASIADPGGNTTQFSYTSDGLLTSLTDPKGNIYNFTYDAEGRLTKDANPAGGFTALARTTGTNGFTVTRSTALNRTTTHGVERLSNGSTRQTTTSSSGARIETLTGTDGSYRTTFPDGTVISGVDGPDPRWGMQASLPKSATLTSPGGLRFSISTNSSATLADPGNLLSLTTQTDTINVNGRTYTGTYTAATKTLTTTTPQGRQTSSLFDAQDRLIQEQMASILATNYSYDARGRLANVSQGTGAEIRTSTFSYNSAGYLQSATDPLGRIVSFEYDAAGRVITQTLPDGRVLRYMYDANDNVTAITPPGRPSHTFAYTAMDLPSAYNPPEVGAGANQTVYSYNANQQPTRITRPDGQTIDFNYDSSGRQSALTFPSGQISYTYNSTTSLLTAITAPGGSTLSYIYDGSLPTRVTWAGPVSGSISRTYDNNFRITSESVNGSYTTSFQYDNDDLLIQAGSLTLSRNAQNGFLTGTTLGNVTDNWSYNGFAEPVSYGAAYNGTALFTIQYTRDKLGRITQKTETIQGVINTYNYIYDSAGRLTEVKKNGTTISTYTYDSNSNRLTAPGVSNATYDDQDRLIQYGSTTYTYTANGELLSQRTGTQTTTYDYDVLGNLKAVTLLNGTRIEYIADGQNRRIGKKVNGTLVQGFIYKDDLNPIAELDGAGNVVSRFVYASRANVPDYMVKGGIIHRIIADHLGSPRLVIDTTTGQIVQRIDYDEFGRVLLDTNPGFQPFGFAGGLYDFDTLLIRFGVRDYAPELGRWTAKDPILFGGGDTNLYGYVLNDPINFLDPAGNFSWALLLGIAGEAALGAGIDLAVQLASNGGRWECVNWGRVAASAALSGAFYGAGALGAFRALTAAAARRVLLGPRLLLRLRSLRFGANDLVYGLSKGGRLRAVAERAGGRLLTDLPKPTELNWIQFSQQTLDSVAASGTKVRFLLDDIKNIPGILNGTGEFAGGVTSSELRYIYSNWERFKGVVNFYLNGRPVPPPW